MNVKTCSSFLWGKIALVTILLALSMANRWTKRCTVEVMFDNSTSGEVPEHQGVYLSGQRFCPENWAYLSIA